MLNLFIKLKKEVLQLYEKLELKVLESNSYNVLKERYQSLSLIKQKLIKLFLIICFLLSVFYLPFYYLSSSTMAWFDLKTRYKLSTELLKAREKESLSSMKETEITLNNKIKEVTKKYSSEDSKVTKQSKKTSNPFIEHIVFNVQAPYLNIRQATNLGTELESLAQVRLDELQFKESDDYKNHYDMAYQLSAFVIKRERKIKKREPIKKLKKEKPNKRKAPKKASIKKEQ